MTQGALDRTRFETIEAYVLGTMSDDERARFGSALELDPALRAEVDLQRENILAIELGGVSRTLREVASEQASTKGGGRNHLLKYAAAVAVVLAGAFVWLLTPSPSERLFAAYYVSDPGLPVPMSALSDAAFQDAMVAYKLGEYAEAKVKWEEILLQEPSNDTLIYYLGSAALASGDVMEAIRRLEPLSKDTSSTFHAKAKWYLFLAYVRVKDLEKLRTLHLENDPVYGDRVRTITSELGS